MELGVQALLKAKMVEQYEKYKEKESVPLYCKDNFENMWKQYEVLGANVVVTELHNEFTRMPATSQEE